MKWNRIAEDEYRSAAHSTSPGEPIKVARPTVFPSVCDWLDAEVPVELFERFLRLIHDTPYLDWLLPTKRPSNWRRRLEEVWCRQSPGTDFSIWLNRWMGSTHHQIGFTPRPPLNVWVGVSVEDQIRANNRIPALLKIPARVRFLSVEPLLGPVDLTFVDQSDGMIVEKMEPIDWVIVGGESGLNARVCNVDWIRSIVRQCGAYRVPCFVKQAGTRPIARERELWERAGQPDDWRPGDTWVPMKMNHPKGGDLDEWPEDIRVRQYPEAA